MRGLAEVEDQRQDDCHLFDAPAAQKFHAVAYMDRPFDRDPHNRRVLRARSWESEQIRGHHGFSSAGSRRPVKIARREGIASRAEWPSPGASAALLAAISWSRAARVSAVFAPSTLFSGSKIAIRTACATSTAMS